MLPRSCWVLLLLLCAAARFFGWLGLGTPPEELGTPPEVMMQLRSSCADLSEEEKVVAKLEVELFDCQASAEGRQTCTPDTCLLQEEPQELSRLETPIHHGLQHPALDETLFSGKQHRVAQLMEDITQQMGNMSGRGASGLQEGRRVVLSDLHHAQERAQDVYSQLESDLALLLAQQHRMEEVMEKLWQVNQSLGLMLAAVEGAQSQVENHLQHLHAILDSSGRSPSAISTCILYGSYVLLLVMLLVPTPPRTIVILLFLACSALSELLSIPALFALLAFAMAGQWLVEAAYRGAGGAWLVLPQEKPHRQLTSTPDREHEAELLQEELDRMEMSCLQEPLYLEQPPAMAGDLPSIAGRVLPIRGSWRTKLSSCEMMVEPALGAGKHWEPKPCNLSQSLTSDVSLLSPRSPCQGLTRAGQRCRKKAIPGQDFCHVHTTS
ncbi:protein brambleberry-like isoform X2 [Grus americana]|uniref:protein brambleberry-like isoform X2 n=1 Tax=Grus americana TaxID=9117 RepID=UPI00240827F6|nr:protein brambleberry-like isoform X2 [Grus americana]